MAPNPRVDVVDISVSAVAAVSVEENPPEVTVLPDDEGEEYGLAGEVAG